MRAIIKCQTETKVESLDSILSEIYWWPNLSDTDDLLQRKKEEILESVYDEDKELVKETFKFIIYDELSKTWGLVNHPNKNVITFRLKNPISDKLKAASENLVNGLKDYSKKHPDKIFKFVTNIEVLEPNSGMHAYSGEVLSSEKFRLAIKERKVEFYVGFFTLIIAILLLWFTSPFSNLFSNVNANGWQSWIKGSLERVSTAVLVTTVISWFEVLLHYFDIRRKKIIRWDLN